MEQRRAVVIGAGPAGLTAALELTRLGTLPVVLEQAPHVGGLASTRARRGFRFDLGGHRFYTRSREVMALWRETLGADFLERPRLSRIYFRGRFYPYPLEVWPTLRGLGIVESVRVLASYLRAQVAPVRPEESFEDWTCNRFGRRLYETFFRAYTEKVWGLSCRELRAEWAAQRLKDLSVRALILDALRRSDARSLVREFHYPRLGPGMMWDAMRRRVEAAGGEVWTGSEVVGIEHDVGRVRAVQVLREGRRVTLPATDVLSSMPLRDLVARLCPAPPEVIAAGARQLRYRDFLTVCLIVARRALFPDNWVYVHDPGVRVSRVQNYGNWSKDMAPDPERTSLGLEYFCNEGDDLWSMADDDLVSLARRELAQVGLAHEADVEDGCVFRVRDAYPVYDTSYAAGVASVRGFLEAEVGGLQTIGRNGLHRYNNQDHSMLTGLLAARNAARGETHDVWAVNADEVYHESEDAARGRTAVAGRPTAVGGLLEAGPATSRP